MTRFIALAAAALLLSGCISLFPKAKPAQLYRLNPPVAAASAGGGVRTVGVLKANGTFLRAAAADRFLTYDGPRAAYIAEARWAAPATVLFDEAVLRAFDANAGPVRLVARGDPSSAAFALRLDVRDFQAVYEHGPDAAPNVIVRVHAELIDGKSRAVTGERVFEASVPAADNRVSAIVAAYDVAVGKVLGDLVGWTNGLAGG